MWKGSEIRNELPHPQRCGGTPVNMLPHLKNKMCQFNALLMILGNIGGLARIEPGCKDLQSSA